MYFLR
ncbi:unnamed protein product [Callosobruchus maculatus]